MADNVSVEQARKYLINEIISMYHTTRVADLPAADHILSKPCVQQAFAALASRIEAPGVDELASYEKFDGVGPHFETIETRARIGERYLECYESALSDPRLKGYHPADCPSELLLDMLHTWEPATPAGSVDAGELLAPFDKYAVHKSNCNLARALPFERRRGDVICTCGFEQARAALSQSAGGGREVPLAPRFDDDGFDHHAPCPICKGIEGCSHSVSERKAALRPTPAGSVDAERVAKIMADRVGLDWEVLPDDPDMACKHGMPEGCKAYWRDLARLALSQSAGGGRAGLSEIDDCIRQAMDWIEHEEGGKARMRLRAARAILAALNPSAAAGDGWLPIKSAPRDGTAILALHRVHGAVQSWFCPGHWSEDTPVSPREYTGSTWVLGDDLDQEEVEELPNGFYDGNVTHWRPLPAAPRPEGRG